MKKDPFDFEKEVLDNGIEIFYQKGKWSETEIRVLLKAGGYRYAPVVKKDCAHVLEHLLFKKTWHFPNELALRKYALAHFIDFDAITGTDSILLKGSSYFKIRPLFFFVRELLRPRLEEENLEREKTIIAQEMDQFEIYKKLVEMREETTKALYGERHPFGKRGIEIGERWGKLWTMKSLNIADLEKHYQRFFTSKNLALVIITPEDLKKIKSKTEEFLILPETKKPKYPRPFKSFPPPNPNFLSYSWSERMDAKRPKEGGSDNVELFAVIPTVEAVNGWSLIYDTLYEILWRELRLKRSWAYSVSGKTDHSPDLTTLKIATKVPPEKGKETKDLIFKEISRFEKNSQLFDLFKRKKLLELKNYQALPSTVIDIAVKEVVIYNKPKTIREEKKEIENFSFQHAVELTEKWLNEERILVRIITP